MGLMSNLKTAFQRLSRQDAELDYLNQSTSPVDLELRQREIDRGRFRQLRILLSLDLLNPSSHLLSVFFAVW